MDCQARLFGSTTIPRTRETRQNQEGNIDEKKPIMTEDTTNHRYSTPEAGSTDWHIDLNENFEQLDTDVEIRGQEANRNDFDPVEGAKYLATDTENVYIGTGEAWQKLDSRGRSAAFEAVESKSVSGVVYVRNFSGESLPDRLRAALDSLPDGRGHIRVTPRDDGEVWQWPREMIINPTEYGGVHIDIDDTVVIESDVENGYTLICDGQQNYSDGENSMSGFNYGDNFKLEGGIWINVASNPNGAFLVRDMQKSSWSPQFLRDYTNDSTDATLWTLQNVDGYCELNKLTRCNAKTFDRAVDLQPASAVAGSSSSATESFNSTYVGPCTFGGAKDFGIRLRGNTSNSVLHQVSVFTGADNAVGYIFDGEHEGTTVISPKIEDASNTESSTVGFKTGTDFLSHQAPLLLHPETNNLNTNVDYAADTHAIAVVRATNVDGEFRFKFGPYLQATPTIGPVGEIRSIGNIMTDLRVTSGNRVRMNGGFGADTTHNLSQRNGTFVNEIHAHDGSDGNPAGHYEWDGSTWHGIGRASGNTI